MRNILYIHGGGDTIGGVETYLSALLLNHKLFVPHAAIVKNGEVFKYLKQLNIKNVIELQGGRIREINKTIRAIFNAVKYVKKQNINLIIAHGTHAWIFAWAIAKIARLKTIFYLHGQVEKNHFYNPLIGLGLRMKPNLYVANSEFTAKSVRNLLSSNVIVNYVASNSDQFEKIDEITARSKIRNEFSLKDSSFIYLLVGRIQHWKGQDIVIDAFRNFKHRDKSCLLIVGDCTFEKDIEYLIYLKSLSKNISNVIYTGFRNDVNYLMKGSDVIIHSSREPEPFGLVIVEGMISRKPVIATAQGGPLEIIEDKKDGLLYSPEDVDSLIILMNLLFEDQELREYISVNAYKKATKYFSIKNSVDNFEQIISSLV